ncbi:MULTISPECIES: pectinesterase family protein [Treponema]|uniref:Pectinesterase catalytic domain-containing protein n=1 Tax=Treponema saccharophilum DSM 2985 TaxID=907348 RepID=H7ELA8_9SPIR|nr:MULTISPECIES: pectinesterase family protein [Treponema]EIC01640.1 hypothetical protein TresaDRAFT_2029 [Treponema saccharophilum DSM 2985]MBQ5537043.1 hypothetical protein [Treponema sp.]BDC96966.1 hypothetical protein TRSA_20650 [Treponema saccharophilum]
MRNIRITPEDNLSSAIAFLESEKIAPEEEIVITLADGTHKGALMDRIFYNLPNPLTIASESGDAKKCALSGENCEAFHKDTENRAVITFGMECTRVTLRNFTIENTHVKTNDDASLGNQAEAICFHCDKGFLFCEGMEFKSRQDTIHVRGFSHFKNCFVCGDVDFIWGYCDTALFDGCTLHTIRDNRGDGRPAYVLQSRAKNSRPGFVFINCDFTAEDRGEGAKIFIGRSQGTGKKDSVDRWDSIALIKCRISEKYDSALWTDEGGTRAVYPEKGSALTGWREFGTVVVQSDGTEIPYDAKKQERHGYAMTENDLSILQREIEKTKIR